VARKAPGALLRRLRSDPDHAPEQLVLFAVDHMREQSREFGARAAETSAEVRDRAVAVTRLDGAVSGSPFLIALVPAYVAMLWEQARMALRIAALHGRDTSDPEIAAELLWLRGAHADIAVARAAIATAAAGPRRKVKRGFWGWVVLGRRLLILAGFLPPPDPSKPESPAWRRYMGLAAGGFLYAITWIFPVSFMLVMAFSSVNSTRALAARADAYYGGGTAPAALPPSRPHVPLVTRVVRTLLVGLSVGIPLAGLAVSAHSRPAGIHWYYVLAALLGVSLVIGLSASTARR
jgi:hypothetical protein